MRSMPMFMTEAGRERSEKNTRSEFPQCVGGNIVGEHEDDLCRIRNEVIEFKHTAYSKAVFAKGV